MDFFHYKNQVLYAEGVSVTEIIQRWGTPCYIYSRAALEKHWHAFDQALKQHSHLICYAVKACSNIAILALLARLGSGFAIVSAGELARVLAAGGDPQKTVFSGVGKTVSEIEYALHNNILCFNVESFAELERIDAVAERLQTIAPVTIRVNPDIDVDTHPYIATGLKENKFGIAYAEALSAYQRAAALPHLRIVGLACHIGSQILDLKPFIQALERMITLEETLKAHGFDMSHFDVGGGLGVRYKKETPPDPQDFAAAIGQRLEKNIHIIVEPGRAIAANAGIMVTKIEYLKLIEQKNFVIVDAGMNDLIRPALYEAWQDIIPVNLNTDAPLRSYDIVGPVCESSDFLGKQRELKVNPGDLLAICSAGAYGFIMSSNYNTRPRAAEILVDGDKAYLIRSRETIEELFEKERRIGSPIPHPQSPPLPFTKMQGLGNDFVVVDATKNNYTLTPSLIQQMTDRHLGIGCDQVLLIEPSKNPAVDFNYRIFNADGSEVGQCGNGARCVAYYLHTHGITAKREISLATPTSQLRARIGENQQVTVNMGIPTFIPQEIPFIVSEQAPAYTLQVDAENITVSVVGLGNPHAVLQVTDIEQAPVKTWGARIERHPQFPQGVNVGFMQIIAADEIKLRVFSAAWVKHWHVGAVPALL